jgi:hypothetical protein
MLPIDPGDGQGSVTPARPVEDIVPFQGRVPAQAMSRGGTIIRPGAVAWGGMRDASDSGYSSCEAIERILASVVADPSRLPGLLAELTATQLWVPLPVRHRPFTDGTAVRLPLIEAEGEDFVPCFTSVQRLTTWSDAADRPRAGAAADFEFAESGRRWQRAGDARVVPHIVVPAAGLARLAPAGTAAAEGQFSLRQPGAPAAGRRAADRPAGAAVGVGHPPVEPRALLDETRAGLRELRFVRYASRAWLTVPGTGEGLVISVTLDDPGSEARRDAVVSALENALAAVPLRAPFPVDATFPGEILPGMSAPSPDLIDQWISRNTRPFYTRD